MSNDDESCYATIALIGVMFSPKLPLKENIQMTDENIPASYITYKHMNSKCCTVLNSFPYTLSSR